MIWSLEYQTKGSTETVFKILDQNKMIKENPNCGIDSISNFSILYILLETIDYHEHLSSLSGKGNRRMVQITDTKFIV